MFVSRFGVGHVEIDTAEDADIGLGLRCKGCGQAKQSKYFGFHRCTFLNLSSLVTALSRRERITTSKIAQKKPSGLKAYASLLDECSRLDKLVVYKFRKLRLGHGRSLHTEFFEASDGLWGLQRLDGLGV